MAIKQEAFVYAGSERFASRVVTQGGIIVGIPVKEDPNFENYLSQAGFKGATIEQPLIPRPIGLKTDLYYLHSDHLGTATYVIRCDNIEVALRIAKHDFFKIDFI